MTENFDTNRFISKNDVKENEFYVCTIPEDVMTEYLIKLKFMDIFLICQKDLIICKICQNDQFWKRYLMHNYKFTEFSDNLILTNDSILPQNQNRSASNLFQIQNSESDKLNIFDREKYQSYLHMVIFAESFLKSMFLKNKLVSYQTLNSIFNKFTTKILTAYTIDVESTMEFLSSYHIYWIYFLSEPLNENYESEMNKLFGDMNSLQNLQVIKSDIKGQYYVDQTITLKKKILEYLRQPTRYWTSKGSLTIPFDIDRRDYMSMFLCRHETPDNVHVTDELHKFTRNLANLSLVEFYSFS